ncbi:CopD family protein [Hydrotalea sp.]|uniref:CopD family protein n=1 Tax=Hydrotalea sp. TaxID=2881279 RepID=UPI0026248B1E|nr:CopD family protein [Hydrotalea sp.]
MYLYLKAAHIIFVVTWFAGLFYMPRLFIYATEAGGKPEPECSILRNQFAIMMKRLWYGITWPSAIITLILGSSVLIESNWYAVLWKPEGQWLLVKLIFVVLLYGYHFSLQKVVGEELRGIYRYTSQQLRIWNEVATLFLFAIVFLATVKQSISLLWGFVALLALLLVLLCAIKIYKMLRNK